VDQTTISNNRGIGIDTNPYHLVLRRSTIASNLHGGVFSSGGVFDVTNNFVFRNGQEIDGTVGGLVLVTAMSGNRVEHNTITRNDVRPETSPPYAGGLYCNAGASAENNLIVNNFLGNADDPRAQYVGSCVTSGSLILASDLTVHFVRPDAEPFDYHIADAQSAGVNGGIAVANPVVDDYDGDARSDGQPDVGADELRP